MRLLKISFAFAIAGAISSGNAFAQVQVPTPVDQTSFNYDSYYATDAVAQPREDEGSLGPSGPPVDVMDNDYAGDEGRYAPMPGLNWGAGCGCGEELDCGPMWTLQCCENCWGLNYGGWLSGGFTTNNWNNTSSLGNAQLPFNNDPHLNLNQAWLWFEREADTGGYGYDWGYHVDVMAGIDGPDTQAFGGPGWDSTWQWGNGGYGAAIPQAYFTLAYDDLTAIFGHFYTIMGYEVVPAPYNFFYSHAYTMAYGEPFTHTGALVEWSYSDQLTFYGGWTNGWDQGFHFNTGASTFLGGIFWNSADERTAVTWTVNAGDWGKGANIHPNQDTGPTTLSEGNLYSQSFVVQQQIEDNWTYVFQTDYGYNTSTNGGTDTQWYGVNNYLFYNFNCCWAAGVRAEWFSDPNGARVDRAGLNAGNELADRANYWEITLGANWRPNNNFRLRPELRYDWANGMTQNAGRRYNPTGGAYTEASLWTLGVDAIWMF